jgi:hypothetical protein
MRLPYYAGGIGDDVRRNAIDPDKPKYANPFSEDPGTTLEEPRRFGNEDPGTTLEEPKRFGTESPAGPGKYSTNEDPHLKTTPAAPMPLPEPYRKLPTRETVDRAAMDAEAAFRARMAARKGYAGTFHSGDHPGTGPTTEPAGLTPLADRDVRIPNPKPNPVKWDPAWLYGPGGPFALGSSRLSRK